MHPLLIPYSGMAFMLLVMSSGRSVLERSVIWLIAWSAMLMVLTVVFFRPLKGDLQRYSWGFQQIRERSLGDILVPGESNFLFTLLNWVIGQVTANDRALLISVGILTTAGMVYGSRMLLSRYHAAVLFFIYSMYPFFINFISSGLKNALVFAVMLPGLVLLHRGSRSGWVWLALAPLFHVGALLIFPFLLLHLVLYDNLWNARRALRFLFGLLVFTIVLSITGLNGALLGPIANRIELPSRFDIYFIDPELLNYRAGFRIDFTLFSLIPIISYFYLRAQDYPLTPHVSGWWLSLYVSFALIYQLFAFAPFADRFAAFSWFLLPFVLILQVVETGSRKVMSQLIMVFVAVNILALQFYTGEALRW